MGVDYVIANKVSEQDFEQVVYRWLSEGDYTPDDIVENIITENNTMLMPIHFYKCDYEGHFTGSIGFQRQEYYYTWDDFNKKQVRHTRWVTDWHPHTQPVRGSITTLVYAGQKTPESVMSFIENMGWSSGELIKLPPESANHKVLLNQFKYSLSEGWEKQGFEKAYNQAMQNTAKELPSPFVQNPNLNIKFKEQRLFSVLAPYWLFNYEYQGKPYYVIVDGNAPDRIDGVKPVNEHRKTIVNAIRWIGYSVGICILISVCHSINFDEIFDTTRSTLISIGSFILLVSFIVSIIEVTIAQLKNRSRDKRLSSLRTKFRQLSQ